MKYKEIKKCRICGNTNLKTITDLGMQKLTGVFPLLESESEVAIAPLELVKCIPPKIGGGIKEVCGLVQLKHSCSGNEMYGDNYGYRSGLNQSMIKHLKTITDYIKKVKHLEPNDLVIDIGSNDGTLLRSYGQKNLDLLGVDPTGVKFKNYYPNYIELYPDFFSSDNIKMVRGNKKAKVVTSIAMFYDLEEPIQFAKDVREVLDDDGIWIMEQSYMPSMVETNSYDTICQEHLEFYCLKQIEWIAKSADLKVIHVEKNNANGGSFRLVLTKRLSAAEPDESVVEMELFESKYDDLKEYVRFNEAIETSKIQVRNFLEKAKSEGKKVYGYGASTKGNVMLQYCNITSDDLVAIAEVNEDKFGHVTPGTKIKIVSEDEAKRDNPDYFLVLPWHFRDNILEKEKEYRRKSGCKFVFCLPEFEIVDCNGEIL